MEKGRRRWNVKNVYKGFLAHFVRNKEVLRRFLDVVSRFDFDGFQKGLNVLVGGVVDFYKKYRDVPPREFLVAVVEGVEDEGMREVLRRIVDEVYKVDLDSTRYTVDAFRDECVRLILKSGFEEGLKGVGVRGSSLVDIVRETGKMYHEIMNLYSEVEVWDLIGTFKERERERKEVLNNPSLDPVLTLGIKDLDDQVKIKYRTITAFLAPFKRYKSITLTHVGWAAFLQGFNVLHVNFEGRREMWESRYDARFLDMSHERVVSGLRSEEDERRIQLIMDRLSSSGNKIFLARGYPNKTNTEDIMRLIEFLELNYQIYMDVVVIDYFQVLGTLGGYFWEDQDWRFMARIAWDLVVLANFGVKGRMVVGALQTKESGIS
ncbi:MAG: hypothetical protein KIH08_16990, partial [Candidatus Freyarchaeota archaeon]|nr:hypothetical protein [Candidatus Jordarchaeia archaeon]